METRRPIYYPGNTVSGPSPSTDNRQRRTAHGKLGQKDEIKIMTWSDKVCATSECVWCKIVFSHWSLRCRACSLCQYCGMVIDNYHSCRFCGNHLDGELEGFYGSLVIRKHFRGLESTRDKKMNGGMGTQTNGDQLDVVRS